MRVRSLLLLGTISSLVAAMPAGADTFKGWYIGLEGGADWTSDNDAAWGTTSPPLNPVRIDFDTGWAALATAGYRFENNFRLEGELGYRDDDVGSVTGSVTRTGGQLTTTTAMANLIYDWPVLERTTLSIGAGAGVAHEQFDDGTLDQDEDHNFAYQGIAGLSYALSPRTDLTLNYRYLRTDGAEYHGAHLAHTDFYDTDFGDRQTLTIGLRYDLSPDESAPVVAQTAPPPPAPAAAPAAPRQFLVFFGFNKSNLTAEAERVVMEAASAAKQYGAATVKVVGHADTVGSQQYNQKLSERRADAVKGALVANGIEAARITATGRGETELLVQTGDNVKEPQNRRATIDLP